MFGNKLWKRLCDVFNRYNLNIWILWTVYRGLIKKLQKQYLQQVFIDYAGVLVYFTEYLFLPYFNFKLESPIGCGWDFLTHDRFDFAHASTYCFVLWWAKFCSDYFVGIWIRQSEIPSHLHYNSKMGNELGLHIIVCWRRVFVKRMQASCWPCAFL